MKLLLQRETANVNSHDIWVETSLSLAAQNGHRDVVELILGAEDIDINWKCFNGETPLFEAAKHGLSQIMELLLDYKGVNAGAKGQVQQNPPLVASGLGGCATREVARWQSKHQHHPPSGRLRPNLALWGSRVQQRVCR